MPSSTRQGHNSELVVKRTPAAIVAALALLLLSVPTPASAAPPPPTITSDCAHLTITLSGYPAPADNPTPNRVIVSVDGAPFADETFGAAATFVYDLGAVDVAHSWSMTVDALGASFDPTFTGSTTPCAVPPLLDASASLDTTPADCDEPEKLVLGSVVNAHWGTPSATSGEADYAVVATADDGHLFDDGEATREFSGHLDGVLASDDPECYVAPPVVPPQPADRIEHDSSDEVDCDALTVTTTLTTTTTSAVLNADGTDWVWATPVTVTSTSTRAADEVECPVVGPPLQPETPEQPQLPQVPAALPPNAPRANVLAHSGVDPITPVSLAALLTVLGAALVGTSRLRRGARA